VALLPGGDGTSQRIRVVDFKKNNVLRFPAAGGAGTIIAGDASQFHVFGYSGDGGLATNGLLNQPLYVAVSPNFGAVFMDHGNQRVRRMTVPDATGILSTVAGTFPNLGDFQNAATSKFVGIASVVSTQTGIFASDSSTNRIRAITATGKRITTLAGRGLSGASGDGGPANQADVGAPDGLAVGPSGEIYIAQLLDQRVRRVDPSGTITTVVGNGTLSNTIVDGTTATSSGLAFPSALALTPKGALAIAQIGSIVCVVNRSGATIPTGRWGLLAPLPDGAIARIAGDPTLLDSVAANFPQVGNLARNKIFAFPSGVAADPVTEDIYVCDKFRHVVWKILAADGTLQLVAGYNPQTGDTTPPEDIFHPTGGFQGDGGPAALQGGFTGASPQLDHPAGILVAPVQPSFTTEQCLYILDAGNNRVRAVNLGGAPATFNGVTITNGDIETVVGNGQTNYDGDGDEDDDYSTLPAGLTTGTSRAIGLSPDFGGNLSHDGWGGLYFPDHSNKRVRHVDDLGIVRTIAGFGTIDGDGGPSDNALLTRPTSVATFSDGSWAVVDLGRIRVVSPTDTRVQRLAGTGQQVFDPFEVVPSPGPLLGPAQDVAFNYRIGNNPFGDVVGDKNGPRQICESTGAIATIASIVAIADTRAHAIKLWNRSAAKTFTVACPGPPPFTIVIPPGGVYELIGKVDAARNPLPGTITSNTDVTNAANGLNLPQGVAFLPSGVLLISDTLNNAIHGVNLSSADVQVTTPGPTPVTLKPGKVVTLFTGLDRPRNLAVDTNPARLPVVAFQQGTAGGATPPQIVLWDDTASPLLGGAFGFFLTPFPPGAAVRIDGAPVDAADNRRGVAIDPTSGDVYFAIRGNTTGPSTSVNAVWRIERATGQLTKEAGVPSGFFAGFPGFSGDGGIPTNALLDAPFSLAIDAHGWVYVLDGQNFKVRRFKKYP
jgi:hypothetical protein